MKLEIDDLTNHGKDYFKISLFKISILTILVMSLVLFKTIQAYSNESIVNTIYTKILGFSLPSLKANKVDKDKDEMISQIKGKIKYNDNIIGNEISYLKDKSEASLYEEFSKRDELVTEDNNLDDISSQEGIVRYVLDEDSIKKSEKVSELQGSDKKLKVLIYHTHTQEAFSPIAGKDGRSKDNNCNVVTVGEKIKKVLEEKYNVQVFHDKTIHDENYSKCYPKARETVEKYLHEHGDFDLIIDLHRDSLENKSTVTSAIGDDKIAKCMFVMCTGCKYYERQKSIVDSLVSIAKGKYPQLLRGSEILERNKGIMYYNQDLHENSILIECGANVNTIDEVLKSGEYLGEVLGEYLQKK